MDKVNSQGNSDPQDTDLGERVVSSIRTGMKREFVMMMRAQSEMMGLSSGRRRVTRSQSAGASSKGYMRSDVKRGKKVNGSDSKRLKKDEEEMMGGEDVVKLETFDALDGDEEAKSNLVKLGTHVAADDLSILETEKVAVDFREGSTAQPLFTESLLPQVGGSDGDFIHEDDKAIEGVSDLVDFREGSIAQPLCTESPLPQVGGSNGDFIHEDDKTVGEASNLGGEQIGEGTSSEKPLRRITRSSVKLHDEETELGSNEGVVENGGAMASDTSPSKLEMKMSKKVESKKIPTKLKDLLETGLLEGLRVRYIHGSKRRRRPETELEGVIQGTGILCSCEECKGREVVTPNNFETHANSGNKRPPEYIYLENGKSLRDVLNACKADPSGSLEMVIQTAIGRSNYTTAFCLNCKGLIPEAGAGRPMLLCDTCFDPKASDLSHAQIIDTAHRSPLAGSSASVSSSCQPEVPESAQISSSSQKPKVKRQGKLTRKDLRMHKSVLAEDVLPEGTALSYVMHGKKRLEGFKKDGAILCTCCNEVVSPSQFEAHAGFASRRKPYMSIYTSNGVSLHQLSLELSKHRKSSSEENDDLCSICEDGGDLLCCENCPRAFHSECVGVTSIPEGKWYCKYCRNMFEQAKFAERDANAIAAGRVAGVDPLEDITRRCIRIVGTFPSADIGGCAICRGHDFSKSGFNGRTVIICDQCEKEYHVGCLKEKNIDDLQALPDGEWFCSSPCRDINSTLKKLIGDGEQKLPDPFSDVLKKKREEKDPEQNPELDIRWRLLSGKKASEDARVWLSGAVSIFHDRFDPIADSSTRRLDLIPHMVYGRHFKDQDFCGMYCAILTVDSVVVSAGIFRVFGEEVAELPLVATRSDCQGKGYFQSLFICIENLLKSLKVKDLVLPAADEAESLWTGRFGFETLSNEQVNQYKKNYQMMIFEGTSVLHKPISQS
ncbi:hypothetical protein BUALT_Bualt13G0067700 [Buddleja alternifolia]|uniref:PHD-type domain-containing protein n=1 Tax=Buddleja alternifolia TaxID=168488 RepID=A0AAV6WJG8_9LAMI|nr:hypothetical protein BUALT_Bualt13G0067700 [Buddleja alternifolia]